MPLSSTNVNYVNCWPWFSKRVPDRLVTLSLTTLHDDTTKWSEEIYERDKAFTTFQHSIKILHYQSTCIMNGLYSCSWTLLIHILNCPLSFNFRSFPCLAILRIFRPVFLGQLQSCIWDTSMFWLQILDKFFWKSKSIKVVVCLTESLWLVENGAGWWNNLPNIPSLSKLLCKVTKTICSVWYLKPMSILVYKFHSNTDKIGTWKFYLSAKMPAIM